jgi:hypothetical protein
VVAATGAGELHTSLDARDGVAALHNSSVAVSWGRERHGGGADEGNREASFKMGTAYFWDDYAFDTMCPDCFAPLPPRTQRRTKHADYTSARAVAFFLSL